MEDPNKQPATAAETRVRAGSDIELARRSLPVIALSVAIVVLVLLFYYLVDVLLLAFAGVLLAVLLRTPADWLAHKAHWHPKWALLAVILVLAGAAVLIGWLFGQGMVNQLSDLFNRLPQIVHELRTKLAQYEWMIGPLGPPELLGGRSFLGRGIDVIAATFGAAANLVIVFFVGLFLALQPELYMRGVLLLVPRPERARAEQVLHAIGHILRWWLVGQLLLMAVIFALTGIGLWLLGVPMALALALLAGLLEFIPYLGPILAAVPALLVALAQDTWLAGYVLLLYLGIQALEGNLLQPLVQQRTVYLPPALILLSQVVLGILVGVLGVMLATPVAASLLVATRMLYVEDVLGEQ